MPAPHAPSADTVRVRLTPFALAVHLAFAVTLPLALAGHARAQPPAPTLRYDIPAGLLTDALNRLAQQSGVAIVMDANQLRGLHAPGLSGHYGVEEGFAMLLRGSGYGVGKTSNGYVLRPAPTAAADQNSAAMLPTVVVRGAARQETATGPVNSYIARRSASATKTDAAIMETPLSVHVVSREQIESQGAQQITQALRYTPGISADIRGDISRFDPLAFRGTGAVTDTFQYLDGLRLPRGVSYLIPQIDPYNLERVEVLKGPASVVYGQAPLGGIVSLVSKRPTPDAFGELVLVAGSQRKRQVAFDSGGALNEDGSLSFRLTALARESDTSVKLTEEARTSIAPSLTWEPDANTSLTVLSFYQHDPKGGFYGVLPSSGTILPNPYGAVSRDFFDGSPDFNQFDRTQAGIGYAFHHRFNEQWRVQQNLRYWRMTLEQSQVGTQGLRPDNHTLNRYAYWSTERLNAVNIDTSIQGVVDAGALRHQLVFGVDYQRDRWEQTQGMGLAPTLDILAPDYTQHITRPAASSSPDRTQRLLGLYAQDQVRLGRWNVLLGGRFDRAHIRNDNLLTRLYADQTFSRFTWRAGVIHNFDNGLAPYASYATSFDPTVTANVYGSPFKPTTGRQYEIGVKYQPRGMDGMFSLAAFDLTQQNVLTRDPNSPLVNATVQTGEVNSRGVEFEAKFSPVNGLNLIGGMVWMDPRVTRSNGPDLNRRPVSVARVTASAWVDYKLADGPLAGLTLGAGVRHVGAAYADPANTQKVPRYVVADAMVRYELAYLNPALKGMSAALNIANLSDRVYFTCNAANFCNYGQGRTFLATVKYRW